MKIIGIIAGILLILSGGYCFMHPVLTFGSLGWLIGISVLVYGIGSICTWRDVSRRKSAASWEMVSGILAIAIAILILVNIKVRLFTDMVFVIFIGVWLAVTGTLRIVGAVKLKPSFWGFHAIWGIVLILAAVVSWTHPIIQAISLGWCIAFAMISQGINLVAAACLKTRDEAA